MAADQVAHDHDAIRVVPIHPVDDFARHRHGGRQPAPGPQLTYRNGPLLTAVEVFTVFWGGAWQQTPQSDLIPQLNAFFDSILTSPLIDQLAEYSVPAYSIGHGRRTGTVTLTTPAPGHSVTDAAIQQMLQAELATAGTALPQPTTHTLYFLYLPPGVAVIQGGGRSCTVFCGYHNDINGTIFYAV